MEGTSYQMVRSVFRPFLQVQRTNCPSVSPRTSTRVSPNLGTTHTDNQAGRHRHRHRQGNTDTDTRRDTHKENKNKLLTLGDGPGPASTPLRDHASHVRPRLAARRVWWHPDIDSLSSGSSPFVSLFLFLFSMFSFDLHSGHGSRSAQNLSLTASKTNCENQRICICNGP